MDREFHAEEKRKIFLLSSLAFSAIWILDRSYRVEKINFNPELKPVIYAVWHGWQYGLLDIHPRKNLNLLVSKSNDGEIIGRISHLLGYSLIRGSKGRGGEEAIKAILKALKSGQNLAYTVDGPRGPIFNVKDGIIKLARRAQVPIVPLVPAAKWKSNAKSWDKYQIPHLFTKVVTVFGDPILIPKNITDSETEEYRKHIENVLFNLRDQAEEMIKSR